MTQRQQAVLSAIADLQAEKGYTPSYEEIAAKLGLRSIATVHKHVDALVRTGHLRKAFNRSRSLEIVGCCPHCGKVAA